MDTVSKLTKPLHINLCEFWFELLECYIQLQISKYLVSKEIITLLHGIVSKKVLMPGWGDGDTEGLILTVVSTDRRGQAAAYCQLIHQHQPWILAAPASSLILDNSTKQSDSGLLDADSIPASKKDPSQVRMLYFSLYKPHSNHPPASGYNMFQEFKHVPKLCLLLNIYSTLILRIWYQFERYLRKFLDRSSVHIEEN